METVFVYGTLKFGHVNYCVLRDSRFICNALTDKPYLLLDMGIPFMIDDTNSFNSVRVTGEVYEVSEGTLNKLDKLEGHPHFYERKPIWVIDKSKDHIEKVYVWAYFINNEFIKQSQCKIIEDGIWR